MSQQVNLAANGLSIRIIASTTFPLGFDVKGLADDSDPLTFESVPSVEHYKNINGETAFSTPPVLVKGQVVVWSGSEGDKNLSLINLLNASMNGKAAVVDDLTMIVRYPDGEMITCTLGKITGGALASSVTTSGKKQANTYTFSFGLAVRT